MLGVLLVKAFSFSNKPEGQCTGFEILTVEIKLTPYKVNPITPNEYKSDA